ncbi:hypothetical protein SAMN04488601_1011396 [Paenibacillus sp. 453mf]|nr:hypothetical protein SAMN04488601_1011396 [Paenibacillus sp. 453mf]
MVTDALGRNKSITVDTHDLTLGLKEYLERFEVMSNKYDSTTRYSHELELLIDEYAAYITNPANRSMWERLEPEEELGELVLNLRRSSAFCVAIMEKYRALKLLSGSSEQSAYFINIESCIEQEFGSFQVSPGSNVLLVGSGSFPMTPLLIAKRTGAQVVGVDIDQEAIDMGRSVLNILGPEYNIRLAQTPPEELESLEDFTHIIFSSTVEDKFNIMDRLYELTSDQVVVAMRYGEGLKSLFNFPLQEVDKLKWKLEEHVLRPDQVFDIALYKKVIS